MCDFNGVHSADLDRVNGAGLKSIKAGMGGRQWGQGGNWAAGLGNSRKAEIGDLGTQYNLGKQTEGFRNNEGCRRKATPSSAPCAVLKPNRDTAVRASQGVRTAFGAPGSAGPGAASKLSFNAVVGNNGARGRRCCDRLQNATAIDSGLADGVPPQISVVGLRHHEWIAC